MERKIADEIMETILRLQLPLKLDQPTEGLGNCFPIAIIQQLQRPEIFQQIRPSIQRLAKHRYGHTVLRQNVQAFMMKSRHPRVVMFRAQYEETEGQVSSTSWTQYWTNMVIDRTWVDYWFVQATAWYLQLDIWIVSTTNTDGSPYIDINGNLADGNMPSGGPIITIGTKSNIHYQSLLPIEAFHLGFPENSGADVSHIGKNVLENVKVMPKAQSRKHPKQSATNDDDETHVIGNKENEIAEHVKIDPMDIDADWNSYDANGMEQITKSQRTKNNLFEKDGAKEKLEKMNREEIEIEDKSTNIGIGGDYVIDEKEKKKYNDIKTDPMDIDEDGNNYEPFLYESCGVLLAFIRMSEDFIMKCPMCGKETVHILKHLNLSQNCFIPGCTKTFKNQFQLYKQKNKPTDIKIKENTQNKKRKEAWRQRKRKEDYVKVKEQQRSHLKTKAKR